MKMATRIRGVIVIAAAIVAIDQLTKALFTQPSQYDPGWSVLSPFVLGTRVVSPVAGAWADALGLVLLVAAWVWALRRTHGWTSIAATVCLAGLTGNAIDRLGLSALVGGSVQARGVPNFYGWWNFGNVADPLIYLGAAGLLACAGVALVRFDRAGEPVRVPRLSMRRGITVIAIGMALFAGSLAWTTSYATATTNKPIALGVSEPSAAQAAGVGL